MKIETLETAGVGPALHAMRNPYGSWEKSDTIHGHIGNADADLSERLANAGTEHCKHLRMCMVWAEIWAPLYWWKEFDTYRAGVEKLSCSTMHTITKKPFTVDMFENTERPLVSRMEILRKEYLAEADIDKKNETWERLIGSLPSGFIQQRTVMMSYAALRQMYKQREGHRLKEWSVFRTWAAGLPESWLITGKGE